MRDKNEGTYEGGERTTPVTTARPKEDRWGWNVLLLEVETKVDKKNVRIQGIVSKFYRKFWLSAKGTQTTANDQNCHTKIGSRGTIVCRRKYGRAVQLFTYSWYAVADK